MYNNAVIIFFKTSIHTDFHVIVSSRDIASLLTDLCNRNAGRTISNFWQNKHKPDLVDSLGRNNYYPRLLVKESVILKTELNSVDHKSVLLDPHKWREQSCWCENNCKWKTIFQCNECKLNKYSMSNCIEKNHCKNLFLNWIKSIFCFL